MKNACAASIKMWFKNTLNNSLSMLLLLGAERSRVLFAERSRGATRKSLPYVPSVSLSPIILIVVIAIIGVPAAILF